MMETIRAQLVVIGLAVPQLSGAQTLERFARLDVTAGTNIEALVIDRCAKPLGIPVSMRPFGPRVLDSLLTACGDAKRPRFVQRTPAWAAAWLNSARAAVVEPGPVWRGRGITVAISGGGAGSWRWLSYSVRPIAFWTQNLAFRLSHSIQQASDDFTDPWLSMDRPHRFGDAPYARIDPGESFIRADSKWVAAGFSSAAQVWGPARYQALVLGNNAGGFPHAFVETGLPLDVGLGRLAGRWVVGGLAASPFAPPHTGTTSRLAVGAVGTFLPRGLEGIEFGGTRFFHLYDTPAVRDLTSYTLPFSGLFKRGLGNLESGSRGYNQLASVFFRLAPPRSAVEVYAEYMRDDHSSDLRDVLVELDHSSAFMLGVRSSQVSASHHTTLTVEASNGRLSHLARVRAQAASYVHSAIIEGHTLRGMTLGAPALPGGGGVLLSWERRRGTASWTINASVQRQAQNVEGGSWDGDATGIYSIGVRREFLRAGTRWSSETRIEPGFGDVRGTNVGVSMRLSR
jgi:hypothetical protein